MKHYKKGRKLGTDWSHTHAMKRSLVTSLFLNDRIKTIESRAKEIRPDVDRVITWAKRGDLHSRRLAIAYLNDKDLVAEVFEKVNQGMFKDRPGGYTRILKLGPRKGDNAPMVIMELVTETVVTKKAKEAAKAKKAAPKRVPRAAKSEDKKEKESKEKAEKKEREVPEEVERVEEAKEKATLQFDEFVEETEGARAAEVEDNKLKAEHAESLDAKNAEKIERAQKEEEKADL